MDKTFTFFKQIILLASNLSTSIFKKNPAKIFGLAFIALIAMQSTLTTVNAARYSSYTSSSYSTSSNSLTVTSPNDGASWVSGTSNTITWSKSGSTGSYVKIELLKGSSVNRVITSRTSNDGSYRWSVPSNQATGSDYRIRITSTSNTGITDTSDAYFSITTSGSTSTTTNPSLTVASPNGGQTWVRSTSNTITWSVSGSTGSYVKIELLKGSSVNSVIASSTSNDGSYSWSIPSSQTTGSDYRIRITSTSNTGITDVSDNYFSIASSVPVSTTTTSGFVASSELVNYYGMTTQEVATFVGLIKAQGLTEVTLRLNAMNEWSSGQTSSSGVSKTKTIINVCAQNGIAVNLDLHTWYTTWDRYFRDSASGSSSNRAKYITYVKNTIDAFAGYPVKAWMVLNEPQARTATQSENQFILDIIAAAKSRTTKPVSVRFMCGYSPSTGHYSTSIDKATDFLCRNSYWDPRRPSTSVYGTTETKILDAIKTSNTLGKEIWISEFGMKNTDKTAQSAYLSAFLDWAGSAGVDRAFAWVMQPENPSSEPYNLFGSNYQPLPAFYAIVS